jgi:hypothetical protein
MPETYDPNDKQSWTDQVQAAGEDLFNRADDLIQEGNARRVIVRNRDDDILMRVPLNPAIIVGALVTIINPVLTVVMVVVALLAHLKVEIVREQGDETA